MLRRKSLSNLTNPAMRRRFIVLGFCYPKLVPQMSLF